MTSVTMGGAFVADVKIVPSRSQAEAQLLSHSNRKISHGFIHHEGLRTQDVGTPSAITNTVGGLELDIQRSASRETRRSFMFVA